MNKIIIIIVFLFCSFATFAQDKVEMADLMRSNGKIYTVVAVCLTILTGLFIYVFLIDRKIKKIEKENNNIK